jgi:pimeloyl-ACP methyl ester carboxylesterase
MALTIFYCFVLCYFVGGVVLFFIQDKLIFHPDLLHPTYEYEFKIPFEELNFDCPSGNHINALFFPTNHKKKGVVFYHHGNSQDLSLWGYEAEPVTRLGYDVLMYDYPTFGKSRGELSSEKLFSDARYLLAWLQDREKKTPVVLYGRSLGTGIAAKLASEDHSIKQLIMETPYYSMARMAQTFVGIYPMSLILRFKIKSFNYIPLITCPIFLLHGDHDELIPVRQAKKLVKKNKNAELTIIKGGTHNDLPFHQVFREKIFDILR